MTTYKSAKFAGGGHYVFSGVHYWNTEDHDDQLMVTFYPWGEASPNELMREPHVTIVRLVKYGTNEWDIEAEFWLDRTPRNELETAALEELRWLVHWRRCTWCYQVYDYSAEDAEAMTRRLCDEGRKLLRAHQECPLPVQPQRN